MKVILKHVRICFPDLWVADRYQDTGAPRYGATFLIVPGDENDKAIRAAIATVASDAWGAKAQAMLASLVPQKGAYCHQDGVIKSLEHPEFEGHWYLAAHRGESKGAPAVVDRDRSPLTASSGKPYAGCYVNASVDIWAQKDANLGIRGTLIGVQFVADGPAFAGSPASADDFEAIGDLSEFG